MAISFSGGRSQITRREPPTMGKQLVNVITCGCESSSPFFVIYRKYSQTSLNRTMNKTESCINLTLNKFTVQEIYVNLTCINRIPVYSEHKRWSQGWWVKTGVTVRK